MEIVEITKKELRSQVNLLTEKANLAEQRWIYCYLKGLDDWPLVIDQVKSPTRKLPVTEELTEELTEKCPYD
tara:strand:- start:381 stop:596 length:216 start_codon:yes stop_codon:yes gene_type:complete